MLERNLCANLEYELTLQITHGLPCPDSRLKTIVTYMPEIIHAPPSSLRQNAYLEGTLLHGPDGDPDGLVTLPSVVVCGKLRVAHFQIDLQCIGLVIALTFAGQSAYTRGTVIPCYLTLSSQNTRAFELLADHKLQYVRLARIPTTFNDITEVGLAVWWVPPKDIIQNTHMRQVQGEIHLSCGSQAKKG